MLSFPLQSSQSSRKEVTCIIFQMLPILFLAYLRMCLIIELLSRLVFSKANPAAPCQSPLIACGGTASREIGRGAETEGRVERLGVTIRGYEVAVLVLTMTLQCELQPWVIVRRPLIVSWLLVDVLL